MSDTLNPAQLEAVRYLDGPCLVIAGAGSGKTRVITRKITHLIDSGVTPRAIAAITFTNKAAKEMAERLKQMVTLSPRDQPLVSTFHSLGVQMLREDGPALGRHHCPAGRHDRSQGRPRRARSHFTLEERGPRSGRGRRRGA
jgi:ATP-dependent DNA helicase Rep